MKSVQVRKVLYKYFLYVEKNGSMRFTLLRNFLCLILFAIKSCGTNFFSGKWKIVFLVGKAIHMKTFKVEYLRKYNNFLKNFFCSGKYGSSLPIFHGRTFFLRSRNGVGIRVPPKSVPENSSTLKPFSLVISNLFFIKVMSFESYIQVLLISAGRP